MIQDLLGIFIRYMVDISSSYVRDTRIFSYTVLYRYEEPVLYDDFI